MKCHRELVHPTTSSLYLLTTKEAAAELKMGFDR
jgi:hypothetical protein